MRVIRTKLAAAGVAVVLLAIAILTLGACLRWSMRCDEGCYSPASSPGQPWTRYEDAWQWHAQFAVALLAMIVAGAALAIVRRRPAHGLLAAGVALTLAGTWIAWYLASPLHA